MCLDSLFALLSAVAYKSNKHWRQIFQSTCTDHKMADSFRCGCRETANIPLIALGLKETKEVDFSTPFKVQNQTHIHHSHLIIAHVKK